MKKRVEDLGPISKKYRDMGHLLIRGDKMYFREDFELGGISNMIETLQSYLTDDYEDVDIDWKYGYEGYEGVEITGWKTITPEWEKEIAKKRQAKKDTAAKQKQAKREADLKELERLKAIYEK